MDLPLITPTYDGHGVGKCDDRCPQHDGKRCDLLGYKPGSVCEPWARQTLAKDAKFPDLVRLG